MTDTVVDSCLTAEDSNNVLVASAFKLGTHEAEVYFIIINHKDMSVRKG